MNLVCLISVLFKCRVFMLLVPKVLSYYFVSLVVGFLVTIMLDSKSSVIATENYCQFLKMFTDFDIDITSYLE